MRQDKLLETFTNLETLLFWSISVKKISKKRNFWFKNLKFPQSSWFQNNGFYGWSSVYQGRQKSLIRTNMALKLCWCLCRLTNPLWQKQEKEKLSLHFLQITVLRTINDLLRFQPITLQPIHYLWNNSNFFVFISICSILFNHLN